jgi:hypothetical protein
VVTPELWGSTNENGGISTSVFHLGLLHRSRGNRVSILVGVAKEVADIGSLASTLASRLKRGPVAAGELVSYGWASANAAWLSVHDEVLSTGRQPMRLSA